MTPKSHIHVTNEPTVSLSVLGGSYVCVRVGSFQMTPTTVAPPG